MSDLIKLVVTVAKNAGIAFLLLLFAAFLSRGDSKEEAEAKRLGFDDVAEMEQIHGKGWHTKAQYIADETARAKRLGFKDIEELQEADSVGALNKQAFVRYLLDKEREESKSREASLNAPTAESQVSTGNLNFAVGCYSYRDLNNSIGLWCKGNTFPMNIGQYKAICASVTHIGRSPFLAWYGEFSYDNDAAALLKSGGNIRSIEPSWVESEGSSQGGCRISVEVSGVYQGTSTRGTAVTFADGFRIDDNGDVVALHGPSGPVWLR